MGQLSAARTALTTALKNTGRIVYAEPRENLSVPCYVIVPASPYVEIISIGTPPRLAASYRVTLCVALNDNQAALINLEDLIEELIANVPNGAVLGDFTAPSKITVGPSDILTTDVQIDVRA